MDSILNVLAMIGGLLVLGWLVGSGNKQGGQAQARDEPAPERLQSQSGPFEER